MTLTEQEVTTVNGVLRVCCSLPENLIAQPQSSDLMVRTCRVCGRNHYEMAVDPVSVGVRMT
jgi:hypothetical protein